jgi:hypothetical protein
MWLPFEAAQSLSSVPDACKFPDPPGEIEIRRHQPDEDQVSIKGLPQTGPFVQFLGPEAAAIDIQVSENAITQHK